MSAHISPAYRQLVDWDHRKQQMDMAKPISLLVTTGAPNEGADEEKTTYATSSTVNVYA